MSLKAKVLGVGAAGNKAAITLIEEHIVDPKQVVLLNTTLKDVPEKYTEYAVEFGSMKGCGKERTLAQEMFVQGIEEGQININTLMDDDDDLIIIVTSLGGGTGNGSSIPAADYAYNILKANVHLFAFAGFEDDAKELSNTVEWFKSLNPNYTVEVISNKKFLDAFGGNRTKAEYAANHEFAQRIKILLGNDIVASETNIDDTDLFKIATTSGFMDIETCKLSKIRSVEDFNNAIDTMISKSKSLDTEQSAKRIGVIINCSDKTREYIDESYSALKKRYGIPMELFRHYQNSADDETLSVIVSGMKIPFDEVQDIYNKFVNQYKSVDTAKDKFFDSMSKFDTSMAGNNSFTGLKHKMNKVTSKNSEVEQNSFFKKYSNSSKESVSARNRIKNEL